MVNIHEKKKYNNDMERLGLEKRSKMSEEERQKDKRMKKRGNDCING